MCEFGMPTLIELAGIADTAALCAELGLRFVELNMNLPQYQPGALDEAELTRLARRHGIYYTLHLDENLNVADFNPRVAQAYLDTVRDAIALAHRLGAPVVNMHLNPGVYFTLPERRAYLFELFERRYMADMARFRDECTRLTGAGGVAICIENTGGWQGFQLRALDMLLKSPAFALTYDVGHDHCAGGVDRPEILRRGARLRHMHLHDATGKRDHLAPGDGEVDLSACLRLAREHGCRVVLETKTVAALRRAADWAARE